MGSPNEILAKDAELHSPVYKQLQSVMLQVLVIFDADIKDVEIGEGKTRVGAFEPKMDYSGVLEQLKAITEFNGVVENVQLNIREGDGRGVEMAARKIKALAEGYAAMTVSDVVIEVFVPSTSFRSLNTWLLGIKLDKDNKYNTEELRGAGESAISFSDKRIRISAIHELPVFDSEPEISPAPRDSDSPTDMDAKVAAVLCEYTYYLCRTHEYNAKEAKKGSISDVMGKLVPCYNVVKGLREDSIDSRKDSTQKEIEELEIIPKRWKLIESYETGILDSTGRLRKEYGEETGIPTGEVAKALAKWDAVNLQQNRWLGMCDHHEEWSDSLSDKIIHQLKNDRDKRFSLMGNKGFLNKWTFFCANSGLASVLYVNEEDYEVMYCVAGSDFGKDLLFNGDWVTTNISQFLTGLSPQYQQSVTNALILDRAVSAVEKECGRKVKLTFIGHSLGGGLASNNAIVTSRRHAITFNAAGLNWMRVATGLLLHNREELKNPLRGRERVHLFILKGEILDSGQSFAEDMALAFKRVVNPLANRPDLQAYSAPFTRKEIDGAQSGTEESGMNPVKALGAALERAVNPLAAVADGAGEVLERLKQSAAKHSMVNFLQPPSQLDKLTL